MTFNDPEFISKANEKNIEIKSEAMSEPISEDGFQVNLEKSTDMISNSKTILIVEDDLDIREAMVELLEGEGYKVLTAADGDKALAVLQTQLPDLILLDLMMPIKDGFEFRREQLANVKFKNIPVIIMTADSNIENKKSNMMANDFIKKPLEIDSALLTIQKVIKQKLHGEKLVVEEIIASKEAHSQSL